MCTRVGENLPPPLNLKAGQSILSNAKAATGSPPKPGKSRRPIQQGTFQAWAWAEPAQFIRWFTDGERRYGAALWRLASVSLKPGEAHPAYGRRKVWREGLEVAMKIKGSQGHQRVEWVKVEHPFTVISPEHEVHANHNEAQNRCLETTCQC